MSAHVPSRTSAPALFPDEFLAEAAWTHPHAFAAVVDDIDVLLPSAEDYRIAGRSDHGLGARAFGLLPCRSRLIERQKRAFAAADSREITPIRARVAASEVVGEHLEVVLDCGGSLVRVCSVAAEGKRPMPGAHAAVFKLSSELAVINIKDH